MPMRPTIASSNRILLATSVRGRQRAAAAFVPPQIHLLAAEPTR